MWKVYLDVCCLNRPLDDQTQERVRRETAAILTVVTRLRAGEWQWISSEAVVYEVSRIRDQERREQVEGMLAAVQVFVGYDPAISQRAQELTGFGFRPLDAAHLACAEVSGADVLLTTDDRFIRRASRLARKLRVRVANPVVWLRKVTKR